MPSTHTIGIISDTHGVLPNEVFDVFADVDQIIHAGDIGSEDILTALETIAPVVAVFGNMDRGRLRDKLKERLDFQLFGFNIIVTHIPAHVTFESPTIRIYGHTHKPHIVEKNGSYEINPGSASQPRTAVERSVAKLVLLEPGRVNAELLYF